MEVLHPTAELAPPNVCVICRETPDRSKRVVDTGQPFIIPNSDVVGRAYVCERCGVTIANCLGFVSNEQAKAAFHAAEMAASNLAAVKEKILHAASDIHAFATDVSLGNERSSVSRWVEGDYIAPTDAVAPSAEQPTPEIGKVAGRSGASIKKSGGGAKSAKAVESVPTIDELPADSSADAGVTAGSV